MKGIAGNGVIRVSWPKKPSGAVTDMTEDEIRKALPLRLVDVEACAIDDTWSGLKLMIRFEIRKSCTASAPGLAGVHAFATN